MNHGTFEKGEKFEAGKMVEVQEGAIVSRTLIDYPCRHKAKVSSGLKKRFV